MIVLDYTNYMDTFFNPFQANGFELALGYGLGEIGPKKEKVMIQFQYNVEAKSWELETIDIHVSEEQLYREQEASLFTKLTMEYAHLLERLEQTIEQIEVYGVGKTKEGFHVGEKQEVDQTPYSQVSYVVSVVDLKTKLVCMFCVRADHRLNHVNFIPQDEHFKLNKDMFKRNMNICSFSEKDLPPHILEFYEKFVKSA